MTKFDLIAHRLADDAFASMTTQTMRNDDGRIILRLTLEFDVANVATAVPAFFDCLEMSDVEA